MWYLDLGRTHFDVLCGDFHGAMTVASFSVPFSFDVIIDVLYESVDWSRWRVGWDYSCHDEYGAGSDLYERHCYHFIYIIVKQNLAAHNQLLSKSCICPHSMKMMSWFFISPAVVY